VRAHLPAALVSRLANRKSVVVPAVVGVCALLLAAVFAYVTFRGAAPSPNELTMDTERFVSREGGFSLDLPGDLEVSREGRTAQFSSKDKDLVIVVGPGQSGSLKKASKSFLNTLEGNYASFRLAGTQTDEVDGRRALTSYGQATNSNEVKIRFVAVVVRARPRNYTIAVYTALNSDPSVVLPRVNAVVNGFKVLPAAKD